MTPIPKHLRLSWYPGHLAWIKTQGHTPRHDPQGAAPKKADFAGESFNGQDLREADLRGASLMLSTFEGANLSGADMRFAFLNFARFKNANLEGANLERAGAFRGNFGGANLSGADLSGADVRESCMAGANLMDSNLMNANLTDSDLIGADLSGARVGNNWAPVRTKIDAKFYSPSGGEIAIEKDGTVVRSSPRTQSCVHDWEISDKGGWHRTCSACKLREGMKSSFGKTADGKPFVILMLR